MQEQFKYRYFIDGKEIDTREEYFNTTMSGDYVSYFDGDFKSSRQINDHAKDILDLGQIKGSSTRHKSQNGETHKEVVGDLEGINKPPKTEQLDYQSFYQVVYTKPTSNWNKFEITFSDNDLEKIKGLSIGDIKEMFNSTISAEQNKTEENLVFQKDSEIHKEEGKKTNKNKSQMSLLFKQFPKALEAIVMCSQYGHEKYKETDKDYLNYTRVDGGSKTYADAGLRHRLQQGNDLESGLPHQFHVAWNALAELQLWIIENE